MHEELLILKDSDLFTPTTWTKELGRLFIKMLARAAVKAKRESHSRWQTGSPLHRFPLSAQ